ncbi:MAG: chemotaxis protein CheW [Fimbriiglobus sp.]|jgi:chemotaxis-related protein WspB|nr:chemotaxis protein CheW [Fimbriiglobus sp.]
MLALLFQVGSDRVAVDVRRVREVVPRVRLNEVLGGPGWVAGRFVYRGRVVPVVDLHALMGAGTCPPHLSSRIILCPWPVNSDALVGLLATQVADIRQLEIPMPTTPGGDADTGLGPVVPDGPDLLRLLHPDRLLATLSARSGGLIPSGEVA